MSDLREAATMLWEKMVAIDEERLKKFKERREESITALEEFLKRSQSEQ